MLARLAMLGNMNKLCI